MWALKWMKAEFGDLKTIISTTFNFLKKYLENERTNPHPPGK